MARCPTTRRGRRLTGRDQLGFFAPTTVLPEKPLFDYFGYFYEPFRIDRDYTKQMNMPRDFAFVNCIQWGVYSILGKLEAIGNWHRIHREYLQDAPPSTELGHADRDYRARWCDERELGREAHLVATPDGVRARGIATRCSRARSATSSGSSIYVHPGERRGEARQDGVRHAPGARRVARAGADVGTGP